MIRRPHHEAIEIVLCLDRPRQRTLTMTVIERRRRHFQNFEALSVAGIIFVVLIALRLGNKDNEDDGCGAGEDDG